MRLLRWLGSQVGRRVILVIAVVLALGALALTIGNGTEVGWGTVGSYDFVQYWGAARLVRQGNNPYDATAMLALQQEVGWPKAEPLRFWNPPWTLIVTLPLALLPFGPATLLWVSLQTLGTLTSGLLLWQYFAPENGHPLLGVLLAVGFFPCISATNMGQISFWFLIGVVGFLWAERKGWDGAAGASLGVLMIKPHVTYLFWLGALWWAWRRDRRRVLIGWLGALGSASAVALLMAPDVFVNYIAAYSDPPLVWHSATFGTWLRLGLGWELEWLQFVPSLLGGLGLLAWLWLRRGPWHWEAMAGPLLLLSMIRAAYGWSFDQVVLLPAVVAVVAALAAKPSVERLAIVGTLLMSQGGMWAMNQAGVPDAFTIWHAPVLGALYWWSAKEIGVKSARHSVSARDVC